MKDSEVEVHSRVVFVKKDLKAEVDGADNDMDVGAEQLTDDTHVQMATQHEVNDETKQEQQELDIAYQQYAEDVDNIEWINNEIKLPLNYVNHEQQICCVVVEYRLNQEKKNTVVIESNGAINCTCGLIYRLGIPFRHFFCAFVSCKDVVLVPSAVYHPRWLKFACNVPPFKHFLGTLTTTVPTGFDITCLKPICGIYLIHPFCTHPVLRAINV